MEPQSTNGNGNIELTEDQIEIVGRFNDYSFENPNLTFEEVVEKELGPDFFPPAPQGKLFEKECHEVFERERSQD
jgi:hypothetical protein